jgi:hypothetical protein
MRSDTLHAALRAFAEEAAGLLSGETAEGAEIPFELVEAGPPTRRGARTPLYCYRPLVGEFLRTRGSALERLPSHPAASGVLADNADRLSRYLSAVGERPSGGPPAALQAFLAAVFAEQTDFAVDDARFDRAYAQIEEALFAGRTDALVAVPVLGLDIASEEVVLGDGLSLRRAEALRSAPSDLIQTSDVVAVFRAVIEDRAPDPFAQAGRRFRRLLTALRLYDDGGIALGPVAWTRVDDGPWRAGLLGCGAGAQAYEGIVLLEADEEDELRAFCSLIARRMPRAGELAWALARFEMACERSWATEALTDVLLGLRALLEPEGQQSSRLPERLAALCANAADRAALQARAAHAISLERAIVAGTAPRGEQVDALIDELAGHLRALLRDVLCGHLDSDLRTLADSLTAEAAPA